MGNVYVTGTFKSTADFDPSADTANLIAVGGPDIFFAKYDVDGNYLWAKSIGNAAWDVGPGIAVDGVGNVYMTGSFEGTVDFDPGVGTANLTSVGLFDIFFAKYDTAGNYLWAKSIGMGRGYSIYVDGVSNVHLTGYFSGTADFDPGAGTANLTSAGNSDIFFAKYDTAGNYVWAKSIGSIFNDRSYSIAIDGTGNVYITGYFSDTADFDPGIDTANLTANGNNIFIAKYDSTGNYLWAKSIECNGFSFSIALDGFSNVHITGYFNGTADFDPGSDTVNLTPVGFIDIFFAKYDTAGNYLWAKNIGSTIGDRGHSITVDGSGNVYITGAFQLTVDFDPGAGTANLTGPKSFFAKYSQCVLTTTTVTVSICSSDSIFLQNGWQNSTGTYYDTLASVNGCDSVIATTLTINPSVTPSVSISASSTTICSGETVTFTATPTNGGISPSYQWKLNGGNVGTNSPAYSNSSLTNGDQISCVLTSNANCASPTTATSNTITITVNSNIAASVSISASPGSTINQGDNVTFTATNTNNVPSPSYQWKLNGNNVGTNSITYSNSFLANGDQINCVISSSSPCVTGSPATSNTITMIVNPVGIAEIDFINNINIYPNPNTGEFVLEMEITKPENLGIKLLNVIGQVIYKENLIKYSGTYQKTIDVSKQVTDIYTLQLLSDEGIMNKKIIIE